MARMYARKKGKAGSKRPATPAKWVEYKPDEVEKIVLKLAKEGLSTAEIGKTMRDQYGIPLVKHVTGKTILKIIRENKMEKEVPEDMMNLFVKAVKLRSHMGKNKKDSTSKKGLELLESKIRRLGKYYIKEKRIPSSWKYDPERTKLIIQTGKF